MVVLESCSRLRRSSQPAHIGDAMGAGSWLLPACSPGRLTARGPAWRARWRRDHRRHHHRDHHHHHTAVVHQRCCDVEAQLKEGKGSSSSWARWPTSRRLTARSRRSSNLSPRCSTAAACSPAARWERRRGHPRNPLSRAASAAALPARCWRPSSAIPSSKTTRTPPSGTSRRCAERLIAPVPATPQQQQHQHRPDGAEHGALLQESVLACVVAAPVWGVAPRRAGARAVVIPVLHNPRARSSWHQTCTAT